MSLAKIFGGGKKKDAPPTTQEAIQKLRSTEELLQKKSNHLENKISEEIAAAKKAGTKNKRLALNALKRKKRLEKQLAQIDGTLSTIEFQREALENANTNTEVLKAMGYAAKAMKSAHQELVSRRPWKVNKEHEHGEDLGLNVFNTDILSITEGGFEHDGDVDDVHDMMDDISEQTELANEISEAISSSVGYQDVDEDELLQELDELEQETLDEQMLNIGPTATAELPNVPQTELPKAAKKKVEEEDDMAELAAWAN